MIDDLLALARTDTTVTDCKPVDLAAVASDCWTTVETGDATLVTNSHHTVQADKSRLKQLFENLIRNAIEHGGEGVTVTFGELDDGIYVEREVRGKHLASILLALTALRNRLRILLASRS